MSVITHDEFVRTFGAYALDVHHDVRITRVDATRVWRFLWDKTINCDPRVTYAGREIHSNFILIKFALGRTVV